MAPQRKAAGTATSGALGAQPETQETPGHIVNAGSIESAVAPRREGIPFAQYEPAREDAPPAGEVQINLFR